MFAGETRPSPTASTYTLDDALRGDVFDYMPGDILVKIDRATMAHGLGRREPFLDVDLASLLISLPQHFKIDATRDKFIFRVAFAHLWPNSFRTHGKQGFGTPITEWLAHPRVHKRVHEKLRDAKHPLFTLLPFDASRIAVDRQNFQTWSLFALALCLEQHPS
jgi:asparagine synthase (glutamine-hydrolysing)